VKFPGPDQPGILDRAYRVLAGVVEAEPRARVLMVALVYVLTIPGHVLALAAAGQPGWKLAVLGRIVGVAAIVAWLWRQDDLGFRSAVFIIAVVPSVMGLVAQKTGAPSLDARIAWLVACPAVGAVLWDQRVARWVAGIVGTSVAIELFWRLPVQRAAFSIAVIAVGLVVIVWLICGTAGNLRRTLSELRWARFERDRVQVAVDAAAERERVKIAADLHDDTIAVMTAASMKLELIGMRSDPAESELPELEDALVLMRQAISRARRLSSDLYPPSLDDGLRAALTEAGARIGRNGGPTVFVDVSQRRFSPACEQLVFRTARELLENARKHSGAREVRVVSGELAGLVYLTVRDNGTGFDVRLKLGDVPDRRYGGLVAAEQRARAVGGSLTVESAPGLGTLVHVSWPLEVVVLEAQPE
jgi:signal transduction histidine kinase